MQLLGRTKQLHDDNSLIKITHRLIAASLLCLLDVILENNIVSMKDSFVNHGLRYGANFKLLNFYSFFSI